MANPIDGLPANSPFLPSIHAVNEFLGIKYQKRIQDRIEKEKRYMQEQIEYERNPRKKLRLSHGQN